MSKIIKKYWAICGLTLAYTCIADVVYIIWFNSLWHLWFINVITGICITAIGFTIGYIYLKRTIIADKAKEEALKNEDLPKENL